MSETARTALVTGGTRGIGRAIALELAGMGHSVAVLYSGNREAADDTLALLGAAGARSIALQCDVADPAQVKAAVAQVKETLGPVQVVVNNAGITRDGLTLRMSAEDFERVVAVNLTGAFHVVQACLRDLIKAGWGRVVNVSSVSGLMGNPGQVNYASAKAGMIGMTKTLARELASRGVTVNAVAPGFIDTDMTRAMPGETLQAALKAVPAGRLGAPEDVAKAVGFLCSQGAGYITGCVLQVDGGMYM